MDESAARCMHFGECGGCLTQDLPYAEQLRRKEAALCKLFGKQWIGPVHVAPSPAVWHYRNKVDFNFARKRYDEPPPAGFERESVLGFNRKGKWYWPLDVDECLIAPDGTRALLDSVRRWYRAQGLHAFDSRTKQGFLRVLLVREGKRTGQRMVVLITTPGEFDRVSFVDAVQAVYPAHSIQRGIFYGLAQGAFADEIEVLDGEAFIEERLHIPTKSTPRELTFRISPFSFFQTNTLAAEVLYGQIRAWFKARPARVLYDLYGGSGGIALACADLAEIVRSVEFERAATRDGEVNARRNGVDNVYFVADKMKNYLLHVLETGGMETGSAVVVDPPRAGLTPKVVRRLVECGPEHILYVSCNPPVLAEELPEFLGSYALADLRAVDLFPHTAHVEVLAALERRV